MAISSNIKKLRAKYNLTQAELGAIAGVSDKAVSTWEKGTAEPRLGAVQRIADHFGISKSQLIDDYHDDPEGQSSGQHFLFLFGDQFLPLFEIFRDMNDEGRERLVEYAQALASLKKYNK